MLKVEVNATAVMARLESLNARVHESLLRKVTTLSLQLESTVKGKLAGQVLHVQSGALRASIASAVDDSPTRVQGRAFSSGDVKYAAIHEFGGDIYPVTAKALHFVIGGQHIFAKHVHMPERSYLRSSLSDMEGQIIDRLKQAVGEGVNT